MTPEDVQALSLSWCPPLVGLAILASGPLLIVFYFVARKKCLISIGLSRSVKKKYRTRRILNIGAVVTLFLALPFAAVLDSTFAILMMLAVFLVAVVFLFVGHSPLSITKHRKGEFWITGCSNEFLARLATTSTAAGEPT